MSGGMSDPRNRGTDTTRKGPVGQERLLGLLKALIDAARRPVPSRTRDDARVAIRQLLAVANWRTPYILRGLGAKRCRYLSSLGYVIESKWLGPRPGDLDRINAYVEGRRG
jgi:hypothetical protein